MSIGDIVILLGVAVWAVIAVKRGWKNRVVCSCRDVA